MEKGVSEGVTNKLVEELDWALRQLESLPK
jgi:hypothetical protein